MAISPTQPPPEPFHWVAWEIFLFVSVTYMV